MLLHCKHWRCRDGNCSCCSMTKLNISDIINWHNLSMDFKLKMNQAFLSSTELLRSHISHSKSLRDAYTCSVRNFLYHSGSPQRTKFATIGDWGKTIRHIILKVRCNCNVISMESDYIYLGGQTVHIRGPCIGPYF